MLVRLTTTIDDVLLAGARATLPGMTDAEVITTALRRLVAQSPSGDDASYSAYDDHPLDERDEWGDLASFCAAAGHRP